MNKETSIRNAQDKHLDTALLKRLLKMTWRYRTGCILPLFIQLTLLTLGLLGLGFMGLGLDLIRHAVDSKIPRPQFPLGLNPPSDWSTLHQVLLVGVIIISFSLFRGLLNLTNTIAISRLIQGRLVVDLRAAVYDKLQRLSFRFYDSHETGSIINRVTGDVQTFSGFVSGIVLQIIMLTLSLSVYLIYMLRISPRLTFFCLLSTPLLWYGSLVFSRTMKAAHLKNRELYDRLILVLSENLQGIHVVKGFGLQHQQNDKFKAANIEFKKQQRWIFWRASTFGPSITFLTQINQIILLAVGGTMVIRGEMQLGGGLLVFMSLLGQVSNQVAGIANLANSVPQSLVAARRVYEVLDAPIEIQSPLNAKPLSHARGKLEFRNVSFEFSPGKPVLKDISFVVEPGQSLAILGPTGAGKSILLSLICRF